MEISTQAGNLYNAFGEEETLKMLKAAGFKTMDYSITQNMIPWNEDLFKNPKSPEFKEYFEKKANVVESHGIKIIQTHAPYRRPFQNDKEGYEMVLQQIACAVYATSYLRCPHIVAHPVAHPDFDNGANREAGIEANVRFFSKLVPMLEETGVVMCIENLYRGELDKPKIANSCSDASSLAELIDTLNSTYGPYFAACLDTGHALISGNEPVSMLRELGQRVKVLHVHDSQGVYDDHQIPGRGKIDWQGFTKAIREIGYSGYFNFEVDTYIQEFINPIYDKSVMVDVLKLLYSAGNCMINQ